MERIALRVTFGRSTTAFMATVTASTLARMVPFRRLV